MRRLAPFALIALAAVVLWGPTLLVAQPGDSFGYDLNWSAQFSPMVRAGVLYPRWTPASFWGLGAPTFYFYPPLGFWLTALVSIPTQGWLDAALQLKLAELAVLAGSGLAMYAWLRSGQEGKGAGATAAVLGAVLYMAAPYHLDDHYVRGAFAELTAFMLPPIIALGLARTAAGARLGPVWLALGWGALILAHLPIALLTGVMLIAPYGLYLAARERSAAFAVKGVAALALGTGLAAVYLVPALRLQGFISSDYWWSGNFQAIDRVFANPKAWTLPLEPFLAIVAAVEAGVAGVVAWRAWRLQDRATAFWGAAALGVFALVAGFVPGFWSLPLMAKVQFPWRALVLLEFALVTVLACAPTKASLKLPAICVIALIAGNFASVAKDLAAGPAAVQRPGYGAASFPTSIDSPEYLPAGVLRMTPDGPAPTQDLKALAAAPLAAGPGVAATETAATGRLDLTLTPGPARQITARRFDFPSWTATCDGRAVPVAASTPARLATFVAPAGAQRCALEIGLTPAERLGWTLTLASLALIGLLGAVSWRFPHPELRPGPARASRV